jgi:glycosyltransferase involved in cell wall biosynthesis
VKKPIAFVIPWYGQELKGGAEQFAWQFSRRLAGRGHAVEVLTTCCASFLEDWNRNHLREGEEKMGENLVVRRFPVRERNSHAFHRANTSLLDTPLAQLRVAGSVQAGEAGEVFIRENIRSEDLNTYVAGHRDSYQAFIFIPYMYGPTFDCLPLVADKAYLHPCLHDEVYAYLPEVAELFSHCKGILYNSWGEQCLAEKMYGPAIHDKGTVVGGGVEITGEGRSLDLPSVAGRDIQGSRFILYLGRRDKTKNTDLLVQAFRRFKSAHPNSPLCLYLAGPGSHSYTVESSGILDFGLVSDADKEALLQHCVALMQPSSNESYSRTLMEAWLYGKPVVVHRDCIATAEPVEQSGGGWIAGDEVSWADIFELIDELASAELESTGSRGQDYARRFASWDTAMDRYEQALGLVSSGDASAPRGSLRRVVQLTAGITHGDAISNQALFIRDYLRQSGYESEIFAETLDPQCASEACLFEEGMLAGVDAIIYHHSIGTSLSEVCTGFAGPKALVYHNITPPHFFAPYDQTIASLLEHGREDLGKIVAEFPCLVGDSQYNVDEMRSAGGREGTVLPIAVDPGLWSEAPCQRVLERIGDGRRNILFVGRISPNKCQEELVRAFGHFRLIDPASRLILVGGYEPGEKYYRNLKNAIDALDLAEHVLVAGKVNQSELHAYYRGSHLFWSMSEHEGFGVPLVESMLFELPVMAYESSAVSETLAQGGITFDSKEDLGQLAFLARALLYDDRLRSDLIAGQRERRLDFHPRQIVKSVDRMLLDLERQAEEPRGHRAF